MITSIQTVSFCREKDSRPEDGLLFNEGEFKLIDENGNMLDNVWTYSIKSDLSIFNLKIGNPHKKYKLEVARIGDRFVEDLENEEYYYIIVNAPEICLGDKDYSIDTIKVSYNRRFNDEAPVNIVFSSKDEVYIL